MDSITCIFCGKRYEVNEVNTRIYGPYTEITCPWCSRTYKGKLLNFVDIIARQPRYSIKGAVFMQKMVQYIEKHAIEDANKGKPGKEKKKPKKDKKDKKK